METFVYLGQELAAYNFGKTHPFGPARHDSFAKRFYADSLDKQVQILAPVVGTDEQLLSFHTQNYVELVRERSQSGEGVLDCGDTPAFVGVFGIAKTVVGTTVNGVERIMRGEFKRGFTPIGGLHHARRDSAAGFCVFNDCGIAIELLKSEFGLQRIAYVDIDAHHGDGVYYSFADDPAVIFADIHEDGRYLYPGTGRVDETGVGDAAGSKLNIPMPMFADDTAFERAWQQVEEFLERMEPEFILLQAGADSVSGDPITHMQYTCAAHAHAAKRLCRIADRYARGRLMAMGGGGYNLQNIADTWNAVVKAFIEHEK